MTTEASANTDSTALFQQLDNYSWDDDAEFQGGLQAILGSVQNPEQVAHLTLRAKCYYFARKAGTPVDFDGYKHWVEQKNGGGHSETSSAAAPDSEPAAKLNNGDVPEAPRPATFAEICEMIAEGKPIPGIKDIPNTILEGQASESQASKRKKPWEKDTSDAQTPSWLK